MENILYVYYHHLIWVEIMTGEEQKEEKVTFDVVTKEKSVKEIQDVIKEAEKELGVSSQATIEESPERFDINLTMILVEVGKTFAKAVVEKYGDSFKNWLASKLGLDKNEGEEVTETESEE
jgi:hypothetical protein